MIVFYDQLNIFGIMLEAYHVCIHIMNKGSKFEVFGRS